MNDILYVVSMANWDFEDVIDGGAVVIKPSTKINEQSICEKTFKTENEALEFASNYYNERKAQDKDLRWVAYVRVFKCIKEIIKDFK